MKDDIEDIKIYVKIIFYEFQVAIGLWISHLLIDFLFH